MRPVVWFLSLLVTVTAPSLLIASLVCSGDGRPLDQQRVALAAAVTWMLGVGAGVLVRELRARSEQGGGGP